MINKITISYSELYEYLSCPQKHYLGYTKKLKTKSENIHLFFGTTIHSSIEKFLKKELNKDEAIKYFISTLITAESIHKYNSSELSKFKIQGIKILSEVFGRFAWNKIEVIANEEFIEEKIFLDIFFRGKIDFIYKYNNIIFIADFKTSTNEWDHWKFNDVYFGLQLKLYKYFYCQKYKIPYNKVRLTYIVLNRNENQTNLKNLINFIEVPSTELEIKKAFNVLKEALEVIYSNPINEKYLRQEIGFVCNLCEFNGSQHCKGNIGTKYFREI